MKRILRHVLLVAPLALLPTVPAFGQDLTGAGATFPYPIYSKWFADYARLTGVRINYQSIGSGGGIRQLSEETVDFGASDGPMSDGEMQKAKGGRVLHVPTVLGAVAVTYNLPEVQASLRLDGGTISAIFLGKLTKWNDRRIAALNPGVSLPNRSILVVHRSDGSGTSYIFTDYLSAVNREWAVGPGRGKEVQWPVGLGGKGNEGVAGQVRQIPGAIGYVELAYARQNRLAYASVRNSAGQFVLPSVASATAAAASATARLSPKSDYRISIVNAAGTESYPIASFTWLLIYENQTDGDRAKKLVDFVRWALTTGQADAPRLDYAPLPGPMAAQVMARLSSIRTTVAAR